jgi:hypothetical protein
MDMPQQLREAANRFTSPFASVIFNEDAKDDVSDSERASVDRALAWVSTLDPRALGALAVQIDRVLVNAMSGPSMLRLGRLIEDKAPQAIALMPRLSRNHALLTRAAEIARIFSPAALERLARALREESARG